LVRGDDGLISDRPAEEAAELGKRRVLWPPVGVDAGIDNARQQQAAWLGLSECWLGCTKASGCVEGASELAGWNEFSDDAKNDREKRRTRNAH